MEREYYNALSISNDPDFQIHLKRQPNVCFINNFSVKAYKHGKQIFIFNLYSIIIKQ